jgi:hypothetical protein
MEKTETKKSHATVPLNQHEPTWKENLQFSTTVPVPDKRSRILEVVVVGHLLTWVLGIWSGEGDWEGLRKGRSVNKQPETEVDGYCHRRRVSK